MLRLLLTVSLLLCSASAVPSLTFAQDATSETAQADTPVGGANEAAKTGDLSDADTGNVDPGSASTTSIDDTDTTGIEATADEEQAAAANTTNNASSVTPVWAGKTRLNPFLVLAIGIGCVLGMIIGLKINAFLALIVAALVVSLLVTGNPGSRMDAVASAFGSSAGSMGIVIAMAAIIGKCMLDSGAADRIVRAAVDFTGERKASIGLMASGFLLAIPVFFDTVFYLLVPLARSLHRRTNKNYLRYLMAIATGGAITHTLVPPTPGPLLVTAILGVDIGMMIFIGILVAIPSAIIGLIFSIVMDRLMPVPMRSLGPGSEKHEALPPEQLPSMGLSMMPILLPMVLIGIGTLALMLADREDRAQLTAAQVVDFEAFHDNLREAVGDEQSAAGRFVNNPALGEEALALIQQDGTLSEEEQATVIAGMNDVLLAEGIYDADAFRPIRVSDSTMKLVSGLNLRTSPVNRRRANRSLLEATFPNVVAPHEWDSSMRQFADQTKLWSNANFALLLAALVSIWTLKAVRRLSLREVATEVEDSLMSGGVIILITAAGGAFGAMLTDAQVGPAIKNLFSETSAGGIELMLLAYAIAAVLKIAQGSSTVAMIVAAGMVSAIMPGVNIEYHPVYLGTAIGAGSLFGSWMNDSGFWVFAKMGGLTEAESLKSWTVLLLVLSVSALTTTLLLSQVMPMVG